MTAYVLKLEQFEGPLDLLLHLVRVHELDISSINLSLLTDQYIAHLRAIEFKDLKDAAAFMDMAATLIGLKARQLLPRSEHNQDPDSEDEQEEWSEEKLSQRLQLYETFKKAGEDFKDRVASTTNYLQASTQVWRKYQQLFEESTLPLKGSPETLTILYEQMLADLADRRPVTVQAVQESLTVDEVIERLHQKVEQLNCVMLQTLYQKIESRYELVAHVLASLQLVRDRLAKIHQEQHFGPLWIYSVDSNWSELQPQLSPETLLKDSPNGTTTS